MKKSFEDQWKEALGDASQTPPPEIWDRVEAELNQKRRRFIFWINPSARKKIVFTGAAAALALVLGSTWFMVNLPKNQVTRQDLPASGIEDFSKETKKNAPEEKSALPANEQRPLSESFSDFVNRQKPVLTSTVKTGQLAVQPALTTENEAEPDSERDFGPGLLPSRAYAYMQVSASLPQIQTPEVPVITDRKADREKKLRIGFLAANAPFHPNFSAPGFQQQALSAAQNSDVLLSFDKSNSELNGNSFYTNSSRTDAQSSFEPGQSMGFGITLAHKLKKRLSLESGLKFTRATASYTSNVYAVNQTTGQTESFSHANYVQSDGKTSDVLISVSGTSRYTYHFLSVPLLLNYEVLNLGKLRFNAVAGLSNEFLISGSVVNPKQNEQHFNAGNSNFRAINIAGVGGVRLSYPITSVLDIQLGGTYQHFLTSGLEKNARATFRPSMSGVHLGISVRQ